MPPNAPGAVPTLSPCAARSQYGKPPSGGRWNRGDYRCRRCRPGFFGLPAGAASSAGTAAGSPGGLAGGRVPSPNMSPHTSRAHSDTSSSAGGGGGLVVRFVMGGMVARSAGSALVPPTSKPRGHRPRGIPAAGGPASAFAAGTALIGGQPSPRPRLRGYVPAGRQLQGSRGRRVPVSRQDDADASRASGSLSQPRGAN